ncbi:MAG: ABC transporter substrate-binding protein [Faecalibacterium sp.]
MKNANMISRRSFLKAAMTAAAVSTLAMTGCGSSSSTAASSAAGSAASDSAKQFKVGIVNYVDDASLNQIVAAVESRLDEAAAEKGVSFNYKDYYSNAQADQSNLNQIGADLVADGVDVIVAVATPTAATMLAAVEDTDIPVVYSAVSDPVGAGFDGEPNMTGTSDALDTASIMNLILALNPDIDTIGLLYDLGQDSSTQAIADAKAFCDEKGIKYIEKNGTTTAEVQMAAEALIAAGVKAVFTPTDNTIMTAELSIYEEFIEAGVQHYTGADSFALNGAFLGYGVDYEQLGVETADMVVELLCDGKKPSELPFRTFDNGIATVNTETCAALGFDIETVKAVFAPYCTSVEEITTAESFS